MSVRCSCSPKSPQNKLIYAELKIEYIHFMSSSERPPEPMKELDMESMC
jgi:hypothetical protein